MPTPASSTSNPAPRCATCGFSLAGLPPGNCPQCDTPFAAGEKIAWERGTSATDDSAWHCLKCKYKLTGLTHKHCPECGAPVDWYEMRQAADGSLGRATRGMRLRLMMPSWIIVVLACMWVLDVIAEGIARVVTQAGLVVAGFLLLYSAAEVGAVLARRLPGVRRLEPRPFYFRLVATVLSLLTLIVTVLLNWIFFLIVIKVAEYFLR